MRGNGAQFIRSSLVSLEALSIVLVWSVRFFWPSGFEWLDHLLKDLDSVPFLGSTAAFGAAALCARQILFPAKDNSDLVNWSRYSDLRITTLVGCGFVILGFAMVWIGAGARESLPMGVSSALVLSGFLAGGLSLFTMFVAALTIRSLVEGGE